MRLDQRLGAGSTDSPTTVLLLGHRWDEVQMVLTTLASRGAFIFRSPSPLQIGNPWEDTAAEIIPTVIMTGPGTDYDRAIGSTDYAHSQAIGPPVLACVTHDSLENADLYENADDFLLVPCSSSEMEKRIRRLALKSSPPTTAPRLSVGEITLDLATYQVTVGGNRVDFAWLEFQLLKFLMENVGRVFSRQQLLTSVWGVDSFGGTRTVDVHIRRLRNKVEIHGDAYFRTVKNVGYGMIQPA
ncbi:MAG TPA: response regulator transcription factor [Dehalococcoidia bacterium]|nr:response regulator transcription factor [Dehalococcoidia bacterium]